MYIVMKRTFIIFSLLLFVRTLSFGQDSTFRTSDVYRFADAAVYTYSQPLRWKGKQWLTFSGVIAGTAVLLLLDEPVKDFFSKHENRFLEGVREAGFHYGKPYAAFTTTGAFYLTGLAFNNRWAKDTGIALGATLLTSGLLQTILKDAIGRARPDTGVGPYSFRFFSGEAAYHSFPSGHASVAFGISTVLARRVNSVPLKILFYTIAGTTAISRLYTEAHWISDIAFGAALPYFCAETVFRRLNLDGDKQRLKREHQKISWKFTPSWKAVAITGTIR